MLERTAAQSAALAEELRNVVRQAEKLVQAIGEDREEALTELRERLTIAVTEAKKRLGEFEEQARRFGQNAGAAVDELVQENPWTVVGIGAALGLILGAWLASSAARD
jgi:ElaB/YqjD/DUF883 family membrane-anchored ribosome-binding protein